MQTKTHTQASHLRVPRENHPRTYAKLCQEKQNELAVYTKLPGDFYINTPAGHYNFEWAIVFREGSAIKHNYFVAETIGYDKDEVNDYRNTERIKIECAKQHFQTVSKSSVKYMWRNIIKD